MEPGDVITCRAPHGYALTEGKQYTVLKYEPEHYDADARFTWPAYLHITDDNGRMTVCFAHRFISKE